jgi:hypothetical protein
MSMNNDTARKLLDYLKKPTGEVRKAALAGRIDDLDALHNALDDVTAMCKDTGNATLWEGVNSLRNWIAYNVRRKQSTKGVVFLLPWFAVGE